MDEGTQTLVTVGPGEELIVRGAMEPPIIKPLGMHFANFAKGGSPIFVSDVVSSGKKPPSVPMRTPSRPGSSEAAAARHPGPLHLHSPGLSPIPAANPKTSLPTGDEDADSDGTFMENSDARIVQAGEGRDEGAAEAQEGEKKVVEEGKEMEVEEGGGEGEEEEEDEDYRLLSVQALDERERDLQASLSREQGGSNDTSLQALSFLPTEGSFFSQQQQPTAPAQPKTPLHTAALFGVTLDERGSPIIVPLSQQQPFASAPSRKSSPGSHTNAILNSRYWRDRLSRRSLSSVLSSPQILKFL